MATKIQVKRFKEGIEIKHRHNDTFFVQGAGHRQGDRVHARSTNHQTCGCCGVETEVYIHSFHGGGKICPNCGVLMCPGACIIELKRMTKQDLMDFILADFKVNINK